MATLSRLYSRHKNPILAAALTAAILVAVLVARGAGAFVPLELMAYDLGVRMRAGKQVDPRIVLVYRSETDLQRLGYPTTDQTLAQLVQKLVSMKAAVVGVDIYRDIPVPPGSEQLTALLRQHPNIVWVMKFADKDGQAVPPPEALRGKEDQVGFNDLIDDPGGIVRRGLLVLDNGKTASYSFALKVALVYLRAAGVGLRPDPSNPEVLRLGQTSIPPFEKDDGGYVNADAAGYQFALDFGGMKARFPGHTIEEVLRTSPESRAFEGKIVIVGTSADSINDSFYTPLSMAAPDGEQRMLGGELHGHIVSYLLRMASGEARPLRPLGEAIEVAWLVATGLLGAAIGFVSRSAARFMIALLAAGTLILGISYGLFAASTWLPAAGPLIACIACLTAASGFATQYEKQQRSLVMRFFSQHVSKDIADEIWRRRDEFLDNNRPRPTPLTATVLFTDLQGFTEISERMAASELFEWLNEYMEEMSNAVLAQRGVVNKYIGDAVMGIFGAPFPRTSQAEIAADARNAVECALEMGRRLDRLNAKWATSGRENVRMRVGIYTGQLVAGCLGGSERLEYTVIGDTVNTASRLESAGKAIDLPQARARTCCITIGESTRRLLGDSVRLIAVGSIELKGKAEKIQAYFVDADTLTEAR